ncbi:hypothetical protein L218DRAFT_961339 [Marasmius fiardii PR-910]|nr:hypothetical protein L218DRAFT_965557 [Marasmius fiardii PR-910]KAF9261561.1 hypothetical protein L218DRAFT_961339 [Marasmius fiardii PR-910]
MSSDIHNNHELDLLHSRLFPKLQAYGIPGGFNENCHFLNRIIHLLPSPWVGLSQYVGTATVPAPSITTSAQNNLSSVPSNGQETVTASSSNLDPASAAMPSSTDGDTNMAEVSNNASGSSLNQ